MLARLLPIAIPLVLVAALGSQGSPSQELTVRMMFVNLVFVVGFYIFVGNSGILSFGHASFMAVGAYTAALILIPVERKDFLLSSLPESLQGLEMSPLIAAPIVVGVVGLFALVIAFPLMRLSGIGAALSMFAVLVVVNVVSSHWSTVTRGRQGMIGVPTITTLPVAFVGALLAIVVAYAFQRSRAGRRLRASREDEVAARGIGVRIVRERRIALVLSGMVVGLAGFLFAGMAGTFNPDSFFLGVTFITIAMLVIGGVNSLAGAVFGTLAVSLLREGLRYVEGGVTIGPLITPELPGLGAVGLAVAMIAVLILRPSGITGGAEISMPLEDVRQRLRTFLALRKSK